MDQLRNGGYGTEILVRKLRRSKKVVASNIVGLDDDELMENPGRKETR